MTDQWKDVPGYEGRYQVSRSGRVKSIPFMQPYLLRNGTPALRQTKERVIAQQRINSGYLIVHLHKDNARTAFLVHRLVAIAFCAGHAEGRDVNHISGVKTENNAANLEWVTRTDNHLHAVALQLNRQAMPVVDPASGRVFPSISQAAKAMGTGHRQVSRDFQRCAGDLI